MLKNLKTWGPILIVIAAFLWGVDGILRRELYALPPSVIVFYEHLIGAIIIAPFTVAALRKEKVQKPEWGALFLVSLFSGVVGTLLFTAALGKVYFISFSVVYLIQKLQPIFAITAGALLLKEKVTTKYISWALLALVAAYFVTFKNGYVSFATGSGTITAALLAFGAAVAWGSSTAFSRFGLLRISTTAMTGLRFWLTVPMAFITVYILGNQASLSAVQPWELYRLIAIALSTGMVALWIYYKGLQHTEVRVSTILELTFPLTAVAIDVVYYHNVLAFSQYFAGAILLFAMYKLSKLNQST